MGYFVLGTWGFSKTGVLETAAVLARGASALDAVEAGVMAVENDPEVLSVGSGGYPNLHGECELDAAIMCGKTLAAGCVMGVRGFRNPVAIARKLMETTPHMVLAGTGADAFALEHGFIKDPVFHKKAMERWFDVREKYLADGRIYPPLDSCTGGRYGTTGNIELNKAPTQDGDKSHDTVGIIAMDALGNLAAATSTSGLWLKIPGRVADSPVIGSGFYADNEAGAAVATGVGEDIMRGCLSHLAVYLMSEGMGAQEAAEQAVRKLHRRLVKSRGDDSKVGKMAVVCADKQGGIGGAANHEEFYFNYANDSGALTTVEAFVTR